MVFAPSAAVILADFGATVVKVESPEGGDANRRCHTLSGMPLSDFPYTFQIDNRNKQSLALDLKRPEGQQIMARLLETADVFVTNYRPAALRRLSLDYETLKPRYPRLIYALGTGYGEMGREQDKPGYDNVCYWSRSAIETHVFPVDGWLGPFPFGAGDHPSGMSLFAAIMLGLYQREVTGAGDKVSTSLLANGAWANATLLQAQLAGAKYQPPVDRSVAYSYRSLHFRSRDGRLLRLGIVNEPKDWPGVCRALGQLEWLEDSRFADVAQRNLHMPELIRAMDLEFAKHDMSHWQAAFNAVDIPYAVTPTLAEAAEDDQKSDNDIIVPLSHPDLGDIRTVSNPLRVDQASKVKPTAAPELGADTAAILQSLGYDAQTLHALEREGVIHCRSQDHAH